MCHHESDVRHFEAGGCISPQEQQVPRRQCSLLPSGNFLHTIVDRLPKRMRPDSGHFSNAVMSIRKFSERLSFSSQVLPAVEVFDIRFDNADGVYYAGEKVIGCVVLQLNEEQKISEVLLELKGGAKTYWTKHSGKSRKHYRDSEPYFCEQFNTAYTHAFGGAKDRSLPKGRHDIPFTYQLPDNLPSSFEGDFGYVRYVFSTC
ncbi:unnamed protein product [Soboliphyme baturini]|uniref:Arrestin_N domain-containing protein n=1 Tax=Soboliphyme baturini TaxID=241478 RepID=A0A183ICU2_9BILA|nr:unnamed protein product [Soboliphyme baturini]